MGEDTLQEIAKELVGTVRKYASTPDWVKEDDTSRYAASCPPYVKRSWVPANICPRCSRYHY